MSTTISRNTRTFCRKERRHGYEHRDRAIQDSLKHPVRVVYKHAAPTSDEVGVTAGDPFTRPLFERLVAEEYVRLSAAGDCDVHERSNTTTLPISRTALKTYVSEGEKLPWYIDLLNINIDVVEAFRRDSTRITTNPNTNEPPRPAVEERA